MAGHVTAMYHCFVDGGAACVCEQARDGRVCMYAAALLLSLSFFFNSGRTYHMRTPTK